MILNKIIIYTDKITNRLSYLARYLEENISTIEINLALVSGFKRENSTIVLNYTSGSIKNALKIPIAFCLEDGNEITDFADFERDLQNNNGVLNFDVLSAIFFLLSRAEEYSNDKPDRHGRFMAANSILAKKGLLDEPIIDQWLIGLVKILNKRFGSNLNIDHSYKFNSTLDVDHFFAYKHKGLSIALGSFFRDLSQFKFNHVSARFRTKDPFDTFDEIFNKHNELDLDLRLFVLCSRRSKYDKSLPPENKEFIYRLQKYADKYEIGIHPSYKAARDEEQFVNEIKLLESILSLRLNSSRQHYILLNFPDSYQSLLKAGIDHDYSMGYPDAIGFRAGTSRSFQWYDLLNEQITSLRIHPFQIMDVSLKNYMKLSTQEANKAVKKIIGKIKEVNGDFTLIWHNSSFSELHGWKGWKELYFDILQIAK